MQQLAIFTIKILGSTTDIYTCNTEIAQQEYLKGNILNCKIVRVI